MIFRASRSCSLVRMRPLPWGRPGCFTATAAGPLASYSRLILRTVNWVMPQSSAVAFWVIPFFRQATTCRRRSLSSGMDSFLESFVLMKMRDPRIVPKCYLFSAVSIVTDKRYAPESKRPPPGERPFACGAALALLAHHHALGVGVRAGHHLEQVGAIGCAVQFQHAVHAAVGHGQHGGEGHAAGEVQQA